MGFQALFHQKPDTMKTFAKIFLLLLAPALMIASYHAAATPPPQTPHEQAIHNHHQAVDEAARQHHRDVKEAQRLHMQAHERANNQLPACCAASEVSEDENAARKNFITRWRERRAARAAESKGAGNE